MKDNLTTYEVKLPFGWKLTGEFRAPKAGEHYLLIDGRIEKAGNDHPVTSKRPIVEPIIKTFKQRLAVQFDSRKINRELLPKGFMFVDYQLSMIARYDGHDGDSYTEVVEEIPVDNDDVLEIFFCIHGVLPDGSVDELVNHDDEEYMRRLHNFLCLTLYHSIPEDAYDGKL